MELEQLRWIVDGFDVTCENCHSAIYQPADDEMYCPTCQHALGQDLTSVHAGMANDAAQRYEEQMAQTSGVNPSLYTNYKKKGAKKGKSK